MLKRRALLAVAVALAGCGTLKGSELDPTNVGGDAGAGARDGGTDALPPVTGSFCAQHTDALFCEDFEHGNRDTFAEESFYVGDGPNDAADVNVQPNVGKDGTYGFHLALKSTSDPNQNVIYAHDLDTSSPGSRSYRLELDVRFDHHDNRYGVIGAFRFFEGQTPMVWGIGTANPQTFDLFGADPRASRQPGSFLGTWHHLAFTMDKRASGTPTHDVAMTVDATPKLTATADLGGTGRVGLLIGNYWGSGLVDVDYVIDNVLVTVK